MVLLFQMLMRLTEYDRIYPSIVEDLLRVIICVLDILYFFFSIFHFWSLIQIVSPRSSFKFADCLKKKKRP